MFKSDKHTINLAVQSLFIIFTACCYLLLIWWKHKKCILCLNNRSILFICNVFS